MMHSTLKPLSRMVCAAMLLVFFCERLSAEGELRIELSAIVEGDETWDMTQARTAFVPGDQSLAITTMSKTAKQGSHGYHDVYFTTSRDLGEIWSPLQDIPTLHRFKQDDGYEVVAGDLWPKYHRTTNRVLITGKTFNFAEGTKENYLREQVSYAVWNPETGEFSPLKILAMPENDHEGKTIVAPNAGCHQRVDLPNGEILLPVRYQKNSRERIYTSTVVRCAFDGTTLKYLEHGTEHTIPTKRGLYEPSLWMFSGEYFLTMRADDGAYVAKSKDGINYTAHQPWTFDNGRILGSYNTQQHWATVGGKLYLIYTRKGANNDHIMRHRAPLFVGEVNPQTLQVIRDTEQIVVPENNATLGNSGVCQISENEAWITVAEGRVSLGPRKGQNNKVVLAKIRADQNP